MKYRKLRITFSAVCGIVCLLLIGLWVRSYSSAGGGWHTLTRIGTDCIVFYESAYGEVRLLSLDVFMATTLSDWQPEFVIPHWSLVSGFALLAATPWIHWRFSLRTLLIGMTLVAVGLGVAVMMLRGS